LRNSQQENLTEANEGIWREGGTTIPAAMKRTTLLGRRKTNVLASVQAEESTKGKNAFWERGDWEWEGKWREWNCAPILIVGSRKEGRRDRPRGGPVKAGGAWNGGFDKRARTKNGE
jgi:hypothetical protein